MGGGGGGGAETGLLPESGMGGGGGAGVPRGAPPSLSPPADGAGGGGKGAEGMAGDARADLLLSPVADRGRGGPMEPKSSEASWAAPAAGRSSSESESDSSLPEPHSSSVSGRFLETGPVGCGVMGAVAAASVLLLSWVRVMRWNGFVDCSA